MKLISYSDSSKKQKLGVIIGEDMVLDVAGYANEKGITDDYSDILSVLRRDNGLEQLKELLSGSNEKKARFTLKFSSISILAPISRNNKILCVALNFRDMCERGNLPIPKTLKVFSKYSTTVTNPGGEVDICGHTVTYEGELGVIIGKTGKNITREKANDYIAGYTIVNDMTANDCTKEDIQLLRGKNFDGFFPMGPYFVTKDEVDDPMDLGIKTMVNGEVRQDSNTREMIFDISEQIEYFSSFLTLEPGDVIATGTPAGTALQFNPPRFLKPGDKVEVIIEGLGNLLCEIK